MKLRALIFAVLSVAASQPVYAINDPAQISDIVPILENIIKLLAPAAAVAFFIMVLFAGFKFINSGGDPKAAAAAGDAARRHRGRPALPDPQQHRRGRA